MAPSSRSTRSVRRSTMATLRRDLRALLVVNFFETRSLINRWPSMIEQTTRKGRSRMALDRSCAAHFHEITARLRTGTTQLRGSPRRSTKAPAPNAVSQCGRRFFSAHRALFDEFISKPAKSDSLAYVPFPIPGALSLLRVQRGSLICFIVGHNAHVRERIRGHLRDAGVPRLYVGDSPFDQEWAERFAQSSLRVLLQGSSNGKST